MFDILPKDFICSLCDKKVYPNRTGEPHLTFNNRSICYECYTSIIPQIYTMAGYGDGGIIHLIFKECLSSCHNRQRKPTVKNYNKIFKCLLKKYNFKCVYCGEKENLSIDHIKPVKLGGGDELNNLQILCKSCNSKKGAKWLGAEKAQNLQ